MRTLPLMTVLVLLVAGVGSGRGADDTKDAAVKKEKMDLAGTWKLVSCEAGGEKVPDGTRRKLAAMCAELGSPNVRVIATYGFTDLPALHATYNGLVNDDRAPATPPDTGPSA